MNQSLASRLRFPPAASGAIHRIAAGLLVIAGLALPFIIVHAVPSYSVWDLTVFEEWAECWGGTIYCDCRPNYPSVGLLLSAGVMHIIDAAGAGLGNETARLLFRDFLALFDALNFLLLMWLAELMRFRRPLAVALVVVAIPSTWVGGAHWGQIDNVGLFFCLLSTIGFLHSWRALNEHDPGGAARRLLAWQLLAVSSLVLYLLSKQLAIFSLPFFFLLALLTTQFAFARLKWTGLFLLLPGCAAFVLLFRYVDTLFSVPQGFHDSSYWFVWAGGGSDHANQISRNGFNLWMLLGRDMESSSHVNFLNFQIGRWRDHLSPYKAGMILYLLFAAALLTVTVKRLSAAGRTDRWSAPESADSDAPGFLLALLLLFHGLGHLGFNVLLSGTHERYLYLGYPFLLLAAAWFFSRRRGFGGRLTAFCFLTAAAYGGFVYGVNAQLSPLLFPLRRHEFLASLHLFLLVVLTDRYLQLLRAQTLRPRTTAGRGASLHSVH